MKKIFLFTIILIVGLLLSQVAYAVTWPSSLTRHSDILLPDPYEPSGLAWNPITDKLFTVSDKGKVTMMNMDGTNQDTQTLSYFDYEAITIVDPTTKKVYIGIENPDSITEYDLTPLAVQDPNKAGTEVVGITGAKSWNLTSVMTGADNQGLEGLAFVPNGYHPFPDSASGGLFYAGIQRSPIRGDGIEYNNYLLYAFDIDRNTSGKIVQWYGITLPTSIPNSDISDLYFSKDTGLLYVLFDGYDRLVEMKTDGTVVKDYSNVPVADQEGILIKTNYPSLTADIYLASDSTKLIGWFSGYPVDYDFDKDGVKTSLDCNDKDNTVWSNKTYYKDLDGDGIGTEVAESFCLASAPANYVSNPSVDCNDNDKTISVNQTYYKDADGDGLGSDITISVCFLTPPSGYVTNSDDLNDNSAGIDLDNDGVPAGVDCNDNDPLLTVLKVYYRDADGDGKGLASKTTSVCSLTPPVGHVADSSDKNDNDYDNDGYSTAKDCNDKNPLYYTKKIYFRDKDEDGLGCWWQIGYFCVPPKGYVSNSKDRNDNFYNGS